MGALARLRAGVSALARTLATVHAMAGPARAGFYGAGALTVAVAFADGAVTLLMLSALSSVLGASAGGPPTGGLFAGGATTGGAPPADAAAPALAADGTLPVEALLAVLGGLVVRQLVSGAAKTAMQLSLRSVITCIRDSIVATLLAKRFSYLDGFSAGAFRQVVVNEASKSATAGQSAFMLVSGAANLAILAAILVHVSPTLAAAVAAFAAAAAPLRVHYARLVHRFERRALDASVLFSEAMSETERNVRQIKLLGFGERFRRRARRQSLDVLRAQTTVNILRIWDPLLVYVGALSAVGLLLAANAAFGLVEVGVLLSFLLVLYRMIEPAVSLSAQANMLVSMVPHVEATWRMHTGRDRDLERTGGAPSLPGRLVGVEAQALRLDYPGRPRALDGVSFTARRGEIVAVVGPSGSGKSSLVHLLLGMYEPSGGRIRLLTDAGPVDPGELSLDCLRRQAGIVLQDVSLLNATVRELISGGDPAVGPEEVERAARAAAAAEFVEALPKGYDTPLGEGGAALSGGQRQRLVLAQILARRTPLLILDEGTSALDLASERRVLDALHETRAERVAIVVTHRLTSLRRADRIVVLSEGRVVETGTWDALIAREGPFWDLLREGGAVPEAPAA